MNKKESNPIKNLKDFWNWLWNSESILSYIVFLALVFVAVKFIFIPGLGIAMSTSLPLAIVESSSMEHYSLKYCQIYDQDYNCLANSQSYAICDKDIDSQKFFNTEEYWNTCGDWYMNNTSITKEQFQSSSFKNGFRKGDLMIIYGKKNIQVGDVIVFEGGRANPIIHRVISLDPIQTKGDHNPNQLSVEKDIPRDKIIGTAIFKIPYVGWIKLFFVELFQKLF
jgi:signal peptidase I